MDIRSHEIRNTTITLEILKLIGEIDEFKGRSKVMKSLAPEELTGLGRIAAIESVGSAACIEGAKLGDRKVEKLLSGVKAKSFVSRDEQEVAGHADAMDMVFESFESITVTKTTSSNFTVSFSNTAARISSIEFITRKCRTNGIDEISVHNRVGSNPDSMQRKPLP